MLQPHCGRGGSHNKRLEVAREALGEVGKRDLFFCQWERACMFKPSLTG